MEHPFRVHARSKLHYFPLIKDRLTEVRRSLFRTTCFGAFLDLTYVENDEAMVYFLLQAQSSSPSESFDLPLIYSVNGFHLHFGRPEFCLVTGFKFGLVSFRKHRNGDIPFRNRLFPEKIGYDVKIIDILSFIEDEEKFSNVSDEDAIRLCLLLSLEVIFMGRDLNHVVDDVLLRMVDYLDEWNTFPWGEHIWRHLYDSIRNVSLKINSNAFPSYTLSGFLLAFKIWILETSSESHRWWTKVPQIIPRALAWTRKAEYNNLDYFGFLFQEAPKELSPTKQELLSDWYTHSTAFFRSYTPRSPPVSFSGHHGEYLKKRAAAREAKLKGLEGEKSESALVDRVCDLEGIVQSFLPLPKEVQILRSCVAELESLVKVGEKKVVEKKVDEKKVDEKKDVENKDDDDFVYVNLSSDVSLLNGLGNISEDQDDCGDNRNIYTSQQQDQIARLADQRSVDEAEKRIHAEIQRLYTNREARLNKVAEEENVRKSMGTMYTSPHLKVAFERCARDHKRKYVDVVRSPFVGPSQKIHVPSIEDLAKQKNILNPAMIERCKSVKPWIEDLTRPDGRIDRITLSDDFENFLRRSTVGRCKFPWCNDITVERSFWLGLCGLDDNRRGWLFDEHIDLWSMYMWHTRTSDMDWAMVSAYFLPLLLHGSMPTFYVDGYMYPVAWSDVERVLIPINEPLCHWSLAEFHISSGLVTFYDSRRCHEQGDHEFRPWYLRMRKCLEVNLPLLLKETGLFEKKNISPEEYKISFEFADNVPGQGGVFGDCGVFVCMFLYRLANRLPLDVEEPVQAALAYREQLIRFFFKHKVFCR